MASSLLHEVKQSLAIAVKPTHYRNCHCFNIRKVMNECLTTNIRKETLTHTHTHTYTHVCENVCAHAYSCVSIY